MTKKKAIPISRAIAHAAGTPHANPRWNSIKLQITIPARSIPSLLFPRCTEGEEVERRRKGERTEEARIRQREAAPAAGGAYTRERSMRDCMYVYVQTRRHFWRASRRVAPEPPTSQCETIETRHSDCVLLLPPGKLIQYDETIRTSDSDSASFFSTAVLPSPMSTTMLLWIPSTSLATSSRFAYRSLVFPLIFSPSIFFSRRSPRELII